MVKKLECFDSLKNWDLLNDQAFYSGTLQTPSADGDPLVDKLIHSQCLQRLLRNFGHRNEQDKVTFTVTARSFTNFDCRVLLLLSDYSGDHFDSNQ